MNIKMIGIIAVLILIGGVFFFTQSNKQSSENTETITPEQPSPTSQPLAMERKKTYSLADVAEHAIETDCWMVVEGKVYDVTDFVVKHPGGKAILNGCGKDATTLFNERPTNDKGPHPETAKAQLEQLYIGELSQ